MLSQVTKSESYTLAAKKPYLVAKQASAVFFDHEFTKLYKSLEVQLVNSITKGDQGTHTRARVHTQYGGMA